ncbi:hypothetical protein RyT2_23690 [Pseudolactococcus yaeyamensis]
MKKILVLAFIMFLTPFIAIISMFSIMSSSGSSDSGTLNTGGYYVKHWSTDNAYTHNLLCQRYGITAEQLDGFLETTGIAYDKTRINGQKLLDWQYKSGLDVRAIIAIAQMESSYGTAGVATNSGANMFGYGAFNNNPENASLFNDEVAIVGLTTQTIILNQNTTFKIQDDKAKALANGTWNPTMGGVYFTDTGGSGQKRADVMTKLDKWIDEHGGTKDPPNGYGSISSGGSIGVLDQVAGTFVGNGQCYALTSFYAEKLGFGALVGHMSASDIGIDYDWASKGWRVETNPSEMKIKVGDIINFRKGATIMYGTISVQVDSTYGHTGIVGGVNSDGTIMLYDQNPNPVGRTQVTVPMMSISSIIHPPMK